MAISDPRGLVPYIREMAVKYGIDPDVAVKVAQSEGLSTFYGDGGQSGGAYQLYTGTKGGGGLGTVFQKETGLNPLDPKNEKATIDFALKKAASGGWGPWYGARNTGIGPWQGIKAPTPIPGNVSANAATGMSADPQAGYTGTTSTPSGPPSLLDSLKSTALNASPALNKAGLLSALLDPQPASTPNMLDPNDAMARRVAWAAQNGWYS